MDIGMELTKRALQEMRFRTKGKWYSAEQVDAFIEELIVAVDGAERELEEQKSDTRSLERELKEARSEAERLERELQRLREQQAAPVSRPEPTPEDHQRRACEELEQERDGLIEDIKVLRRFRETFREAVERDAAALSDQVKGLDSDRLLG